MTVKKIFFWVSSIRTRIILVFLILLMTGGLATTTFGSWIVSTAILDQAQRKVAHDINTAWMVYNNRKKELKNSIALTSHRIKLMDCLQRELDPSIHPMMKKIKEQFKMDFFTLVNCEGKVLLRTTDDGSSACALKEQKFMRAALSGQTVSSTEIFTRECLDAESAQLAGRAYVEFVPTPNARERPETFSDSGMVIVAASPVYGPGGDISGVLYGGVLVNRNYEIVDRLKALVYRGEKFKGQDTGTSTIFQDDVRIATNVMTIQGHRAIGTRVSEEVADKLLDEGDLWRGEAFVVKDWYLSAYDPIKDLSGNVIGILYVGVLKAPYVAVRNHVIITFFIIAILCLVAIIIGTNFLTRGIIRPLEKLATATEKVAAGNLDVEVKYESSDEIGRLGKSFNNMMMSLNDMRKLWEARLQDQLVQSEKLASLGKMAAGVAHEMNSPLTGIMTFSHLLRRDCNDETKQDYLDTIIGETDRCARIVRQLLDFAREIQPDMKPANINGVIGNTLSLVEHQAIFHDIEVAFKLDKDIKKSLMDANQIKQALLNIILNAVDAMEGKGRLTIGTRILMPGGKVGKGEEEWIELKVSDTGSGIPHDDIDKIFDPFFTTKDVGEGTGLGLAVTYGIIKRHGGDITVESTVGEGTTFIIKVPAIYDTPV